MATSGSMADTTEASVRERAAASLLLGLACGLEQFLLKAAVPKAAAQEPPAEPKPKASPAPPATPKKAGGMKAGRNALLAGLRSGAVAKIVDKMEEQGGPEETPTAAAPAPVPVPPPPQVVVPGVPCEPPPMLTEGAVAPGNAAGSDLDLEQLRQKLHQSLSEHLQKGDLQEITDRAVSPRRPAGKDGDKKQVEGSAATTEQSRLQLRSLMMDAALGGKLEECFQAVLTPRGPESQPASPSVARPSLPWSGPTLSQGDFRNSLALHVGFCPSSPRLAPIQEVDTALEQLRQRAMSGLTLAMDTQRLEEALQQALRAKAPQEEPASTGEAAVAAPAVPAPAPPAVASGASAKVSEPPVATAPQPPSPTKEIPLRLARAISERDRRIGELEALVRQTALKLQDRMTMCGQLEQNLMAARLELTHLELDLEHGQKALEGADRNRLALEVRGQDLETTLANLDKYPGSAYPASTLSTSAKAMAVASDMARSELSTAATSQDIAANRGAEPKTA